VNSTPTSLERRARAYVFSVIAVGVGVAAYSIYDLIRHPAGLEWLILVGLTVASGWATLRIPGGPISFSISDTFNIAAALLFGPSAGAVTAALDGIVLSARMESNTRSVERVLFNMAAVTIALWVAAQVFFAIEGNHPALVGPVAALRLPRHHRIPQPVRPARTCECLSPSRIIRLLMDIRSTRMCSGRISRSTPTRVAGCAWPTARIASMARSMRAAW